MSQAAPQRTQRRQQPRMRRRELLLLALFAWAAVHLFDWAVLHAVFRADAEACRAAQGACWGVVAEKWRPMLFGRYPYADQWRPAFAVTLLSATTLLSAWPRFWRWWLLPLWPRLRCPG